MDPTTTSTEEHLADCDQPEPGWWRHTHQHHHPRQLHYTHAEAIHEHSRSHPHYHWRTLNHLDHHNITDQQQHWLERDPHDP